jgi:hypothetical protein
MPPAFFALPGKTELIWPNFRPAIRAIYAVNILIIRYLRSSFKVGVQAGDDRGQK